VGGVSRLPNSPNSWSAAHAGKETEHSRDLGRRHRHLEPPVGALDHGLDEAPKRGWILIDMRNDWRVIYPFEREARPAPVAQSAPAASR